MKINKLTFIGGDLRSAYACRYLSEKGYDADIFLAENANQIPDNLKRDAFPYSDCYILGVPALDEHSLINAPLSERNLSLKDFFHLIPKHSFVTGGLLTSDFLSLAKENGITASDYFRSEELKIKNAVPTAEGALEIAIRETPVTLSDSHILLIGYGRITKALIPMLKALGARVSVCTRNPDSLVWCSVLGCEPVTYDELNEKISDFNIIFNTAPKKVLFGDTLTSVSRDALIIDLASRPGGVDLNESSKNNLRVIWALGLPGKCAPVSAGKIIADTVLHIIDGR